MKIPYKHLNNGDCPDDNDQKARDTDCELCRLLINVEKRLNKNLSHLPQSFNYRPLQKGAWNVGDIVNLIMHYKDFSTMRGGIKSAGHFKIINIKEKFNENLNRGKGGTFDVLELKCIEWAEWYKDKVFSLNNICEITKYIKR